MCVSSLASLLSTRFDSPQQRGKVFERLLVSAFRTHPGEYGPQRFSNVWHWNEWPDRAHYGYSNDIGIDIVAEQTQAWGGGLCAIQSKLYDTNSTISKQPVDSFLSASSGKAFSSRLLVVTAELNTNAAQVVQQADPRCEVLHAVSLDQWDVDWEQFLDTPDSIKFDHQRYVPYPFQDDAVQAVVKGLDDHQRGKLILPCGTGKSVVSLWAAEKIAGRGGTVLYLVPSIALMSQTMREWSAQHDPGIPQRYIGVCSDTRTGRADEDADLAELALPVTTDPEKIAAGLSNRNDCTMTVVFSTYQSLEIVSQAQQISDTRFDLAVCDEAHRTTGITETGKGTSWTLIHDHHAIKADRRLFMTATPRLYTEKAKTRAAKRTGNMFDAWSMDDQHVYGPELYRMSFADAVEEPGKPGYLTDFEVVVVAVASSVVDEYLKGEPFQFKDEKGTDRKIEAEDVINLIGCWDALADPATRTAQGRITGSLPPEGSLRSHLTRAIAFTNRIKDSENVAAGWQNIVNGFASKEHETLDFEVRHIDGKTNALKRAQQLDWLRQADPEDQKARVISNAKCLTEGVDVPALDAVIFLAPKQSETEIVQAIGRVMRKAPGKQCGYVIVPVIIEDGLGIVDRDVLNGTAFKTVWKMIRALRAHDERLDVEVNTADLTGRIPKTRFIGVGVCEGCGSAGCDGKQCGTEGLPLSALPWRDAIASMLVKQCGDKDYWADWGAEVATIYQSLLRRINKCLREDTALKTAFNTFSEDMSKTIGRNFEDQELTKMLAQHVVTLPVFTTLFQGSGFADRNPISKALNKLQTEFEQAGEPLNADAAQINRFYASVRDRLQAAPDADSRIQILLDVYQSFFQRALPEDSAKLGIVYTPVELVDFVLRSVDAVIKHEFGRGITAEDIDVLDPFSGTGTFLNRLLTIQDHESNYLIRDDDITRKYSPTTTGLDSQDPPELHANEIVPLAYYLSAIKIEEGYKARTGSYQPFEGLVLRDSLNADKSSITLPGIVPLAENSARASSQDDAPITVIVGNPPWSAGQKSSGDDNPRDSHPVVEDRARDTYIDRHVKVTGKPPGGNAASNSYMKAIRWASDRLNWPSRRDPNPDGTPKSGVIAFVHPNSLTTATSLAGARACLRDEFTSIYVINLRGDMLKSGEESLREGGQIFQPLKGKGGSRNGVQITILVRNMKRDLTKPATLKYAAVPEYQTREQKFEWLRQLRDATSEQFETVPFNDRHDWINLTDGTFENMIAVCETGRTEQRTGESIADANASGIKTNLDAYVYAFTYGSLVSKMLTLIEEYNEAVDYIEAGFSVQEACENEHPDKIKWSDKLKQSAKQCARIEFDETKVIEVLYRPFVKAWLYADDRILSSCKSVLAMFPANGGGQRQADSLSQHHPTEHSSRFSQPAQHHPTSTCSAREATGQHPDSVSDQHTVQHDDTLLSGDTNTSRPESGGTSSSLPSDTTPEVTVEGGGAHLFRDSQQQIHIRSARNQTSNRSQRLRNKPAEQTLQQTQTAITVAGPHNMAVFGTLAAEITPDLHLTGPGQSTRIMPRARK